MQTRLEAAGPKTMQRYRWFFLTVAAFDGVLGLVFFLFYKPIFNALGIAEPENSSYVLLIAAFVAVQGLGYYLVSRNMLRNVDLVKVGVVYKLIYTALSVYYVVSGQLLHNIFAWFGAFDALFLIGFVMFLRLAQQIEAVEDTPGTHAGMPVR
jgi:hypothetical protein